MPTITYRGTHADLKKILRTIPQVVTGRVPDPLRVAQALQLRLGVRLLSLVQADFVTKSRGGAGKDGVRWAPLSDRTVAARERKARKVRRKASQRHAGKYDILRDTARLFRSLTPGVEDRPAKAEGQVLKPGFNGGRGEVIVGTNVPYARWHQDGTATMPARPVLPVGGKLPPAYEQPLLDAALRGCLKILEVLTNNRGMLA